MKKRELLLSITVALAILAAACLHWRELALADARVQRLARPPLPANTGAISFASLGALPPPVQRYFRNVLTDGQAWICIALLEQTGELRTDAAVENWMAFSATEVVVPRRGFVWDARVALPWGMHLRVLDSFIDGVGSGRVSVLTAIPVGGAHDEAPLNSGALHRYLAEAVWFPTALLPGSGVHWTAIDAKTARATIAVGGVPVSLEFRFNERNEIESVYSPGRWGTFDGGYEQRRWEGRFHDYETVQGMRVPRRGEVGWHADNGLEIVWRGTVGSARFAMCEHKSEPSS